MANRGLICVFAKPPVSVLDAWFDVDRAEDLDRLRSMMGRGELHATETARFLTTFHRA